MKTFCSCKCWGKSHINKIFVLKNEKNLEKEDEVCTMEDLKYEAKEFGLCLKVRALYNVGTSIMLLPYRKMNGGTDWQKKCLTKSQKVWASLVAQWLRICLPTQGTQVRALVWEDPTCHGATRPVSHYYWACASGACAPPQERPR